METHARDKLEQLIRKLDLRERMSEADPMDDYARKKVKVAERLFGLIVISSFLIYVVVQPGLDDTHKTLVTLAVLVCAGIIAWRETIWRNLRESVSWKYASELELLNLGLELASSYGYELTLAVKPGSDSLRVSLRKGGKEMQFMEIYLGIGRPYSFLRDSYHENKLGTQLHLGVHFDRDTLNHLGCLNVD